MRGSGSQSGVGGHPAEVRTTGADPGLPPAWTHGGACSGVLGLTPWSWKAAQTIPDATGDTT